MSPDERAIHAVIAAWAAATASGDAAKILNLMTEDIVFLTAGNPPMRRDAFRKGFENMVRSVSVKPKPKVEQITVEGDLAVCWGTLEIELTPLAGGAARVAKGHTLTALRRGQDGQWRIFRDANLLSAFAQRG